MYIDIRRQTIANGGKASEERQNMLASDSSFHMSESSERQAKHQRAATHRDFWSPPRGRISRERLQRPALGSETAPRPKLSQ